MCKVHHCATLDFVEERRSSTKKCRQDDLEIAARGDDRQEEINARAE